MNLFYKLNQILIFYNYMFCQYKNILGEVGKGIHKYRLFNIAYIDVLLTIIASYLISKLVNIKFWKVTILLFILGILLHRLFCVNTTINTFLLNLI